MTRQDKLITKFKNNAKNFSWLELTSLLRRLEFIEIPNKKTGGSRRKFYNKSKNIIIHLHEPHPTPYLKEYAIKQLKEKLTEEGLI